MQLALNSLNKETHAMYDCYILWIFNNDHNDFISFNFKRAYNCHVSCLDENFYIDAYVHAGEARSLKLCMMILIKPLSSFIPL